MSKNGKNITMVKIQTVLGSCGEAVMACIDSRANKGGGQRFSSAAVGRYSV